MEKIIERNLNTQHEFFLRPSRKKTNYTTLGDYNNTKNNQPRKAKKKENHGHKCGKKWILGNRWEDMPLYYYRTVNGKKVEVPRLKNEIKITYNLDFVYDKLYKRYH